MASAARRAWPAARPGAEPNNWESAFSGSVWEYDEASGEYFLHVFSRKQPDLNWENPEVREAVYSMMRWWLDRGVDGFRMDVINLISKDPALPDGIVHSGTFGDSSPYLVNGPRIHEFLAELDREVLRDATARSSPSARRPARPSSRRGSSPTPTGTRSTWSSPSSTSASTTRRPSGTWSRCG